MEAHLERLLCIERELVCVLERQDVVEIFAVAKRLVAFVDEPHTVLPDGALEQNAGRIQSLYYKCLNLVEDRLWHDAMLAGCFLLYIAPTDYVFSRYILDGLLGALVEGESLAKHVGRPTTDLSITFIGCGPYPVSMFGFAMLGFAECIGVDIEPEAIRRVQLLAEKVMTKTKYRFELADGSSLNFATSKAVVVAAMVDHKEGVLRAFRETAQEGSVIVCRTAQGLGRLLYRPLDASRIPAGLETVQDVQSGTSNFSAIILRQTKP